MGPILEILRSHDSLKERKRCIRSKDFQQKKFNNSVSAKLKELHLILIHVTQLFKELACSGNAHFSTAYY